MEDTGSPDVLRSGPSGTMLDLAAGAIAGPDAEPWLNPDAYWASLTGAVAGIPAPAAVLELNALRWNTRDLVRRAAGVPLRIASKSLRVRGVLQSLQQVPGISGILAFTLAEALWLARDFDDVVVGYPTADREALRRLAGDELLASRVTLMVDGEEQLDLIDAVLPPASRCTLRICLDADASWRSRLLGFIGTRRSPLQTPAQVAELGRAVASRPGFRLVGLMMYEAQVAGVGNAVPGAAVRNRLMRLVQDRSMAELTARRGRIVQALGELANLEFVNGGGTGSVEATAADPAVTEITAGSGIFAGHLFNNYRSFSPAPAAAVALDVVRRPGPGFTTVLGGGWIASGPPGSSRVPQIAWPRGLRLLPREGAGEVQTPLAGPAAGGLRPGDRVWLRHAKSGELSERVNEFHLVRDGQVAAVLPTYRGEGKAFL